MWVIRIDRQNGTKGYVVQEGVDGYNVAYHLANAAKFKTYDEACDFIDEHPSLLSVRSRASVVRA